MDGLHQQNDKTILLTGCSGFLGANIAEYFLQNGYTIVALIRKQSDLWRCKNYITSPGFITVETDENDYEDKVIELKPATLIHCAWGGVKLAGRDDWDEQMKSIHYTYQVLQLGRKAGVQKIISCGSQFEYGFCNGRISEDFPVNPNSAYSAAKVAAYNITKQFCEQHDIEWQWLRLFSMIGKYEDQQWLTSFVIKNIMEQNAVNLTACEQKLDYADTGFLMKAFHQVVLQKNRSGLYNLSSNTCIQLKDLVMMIADRLKEYHPRINFGALPYRHNQVMHIEGNSDKFFTAFDFHETPDLAKGVTEIINYYKAS